MSAPTDPLPMNVKQPDLWDRAAAPPDVPIVVQERAIEELLHAEPGLLQLPVAEMPADLLAEPAPPVPSPDLQSQAVNNVEEFKPTDDEWENVKELEFPQRQPAALEPQPYHKPEVLERDAQGLDGGGDWKEVEAERTQADDTSDSEPS